MISLISNYAALGAPFDYAIMLVGCQSVLRWSKAKILVEDKYVSKGSLIEIIGLL